MNYETSVKLEDPKTLTVQKELKELIEAIEQWPEWKIQSMQNGHKSASFQQIIYHYSITYNENA